MDDRYPYSRAGRIALSIMVPICLYLFTAIGVFGWRHPWMTSTERLAYTGRMLTFDRVTREEVRAWEDSP